MADQSVPQMTDGEVIAELRSDSLVNRVRKECDALAGLLEQASEQERPSPIAVRRAEFAAAREIIALVEAESPKSALLQREIDELRKALWPFLKWYEEGMPDDEGERREAYHAAKQAWLAPLVRAQGELRRTEFDHLLGEPDDDIPNCPMETGLRPCECDLPRCPVCNYTEHDARFEGDHSACSGTIPAQREPQP